MPPIYFQKPEAALKRAEELIKVDKAADALDTLHDTIKSRRFKQWTEVHQDIMFKHLELCVLLKKPHVAKDALFQYKALTQQYKPDSLQTVIEKFIDMAESKTEEAQKTSIEKVEEIDDLDQGDIPETLLLSVVSGAAAKDRMDRTVLAPWLRFLWDSYRNCLELLRNNAQVETLYHKIARQTFQFCAKYQRRTEFRKLCELLRLHLNHIQKHQHLSHVVKLNSQDSLTLMQDTRLHQLDTAIQMELWQEAYKSAEDVHGMMQLSKDKDKKMVKPGSFVNYYDKLALVFWKAGNSLFHAAALMQKFTIYKEMKKTFAAEEAQEQATRVLLATLSIPDGADGPSDLTRHLDIEEQHISNIRLLSNLLRLPIAPTRAGILKEVARLNLPETASESARVLYKLLENNFAPLRLSQQVDEQLAIINSTANQQYVEAIRNVAATKSLKQIATIYGSISWTRLQKIIPSFSELELERLIVDVSKHRFVRAQIDHRNGCVRFGSSDAALAGGIDLEDGDTYREGQTGVEDIRTHLEHMYDRLRVTVESMNCDKRQQDLVSRVESHAKKYENSRPIELERMANRRRKIENYKETSERVKAERTQQVQAEMQKREEAKRAEEMKRLELENQESEKRRKQAEQEEVQRKIRQDQLRKMQNTAIYQAIIREKGERVFQEMDPEALLREQRERFDKERQETQKRLQQQDKLFDHHVRALHLEEMSERKAIMHKRLADGPKLHEEYELKRIEKAKVERENALQLWDRLVAIRDESDDWIAQVKNNNEEDFQSKMAEFNAKLNAVREHRLQERAEQRKRERRDKWLRNKAEEERRRREEEERLRQQQADAQRRAGREARDDIRRRDDDSKAMTDGDWRNNLGRSQQPRSERPPMRERDNLPSKEPEGNWRSQMGSGPPPPPSGVYGRQAPPSRTMERRVPDSEAPSRTEFGTRRVERTEPRAPPANNGPPEGVWQRGQVVTKQEPAPTPAAPPKSSYVPPALRNRGGSSQEEKSSPRNFGDRRPPPPRTGGGSGGGAAGGSDSSNWRRN